VLRLRIGKTNAGGVGFGKQKGAWGVPERRKHDMMTVQEIQGMTFEKALISGYDMKSVDVFIEQVTEDYAALQKENAALKSKMKVLVDKIEEYRSVEEGMRRALVSAQSIAQETMDKAKTDADQIMTAVRAEAEKTLAGYRAQLAEEKEKLRLAHEDTVSFVEKMNAFYAEQMRKMEELSAWAEREAAVQQTELSDIPEEETDLGDTRPLDLVPPAEQPQPTEEEPVAETESRFHITEVSLSDGTGGRNEGKAKFDFGDLKFGTDYNLARER
jgi:cell division initiation protein